MAIWKIKEMKCVNCFQPMQSKSNHKKYCCPKCAKEYKNKTNPPKVESNYSDIAKITVEARKNGMSYGQYVGMTEYPVKVIRKWV